MLGTEQTFSIVSYRTLNHLKHLFTLLGSLSSRRGLRVCSPNSTEYKAFHILDVACMY